MAAIHSTGLFSIRFLLLSLLVTPLRAIFNWPRITQVRRLLGLAALAYAVAHLVLYADDQKWQLLTVVSEITLRFYLTIGFVALLGLAVLGVTSTDAWLRRLGARWKRLHRIAYGIGALAAFHFFLQSKADVSEASLMAGLLVWLMAWRALPAGPDRQPLPLLLLAGASALGTVGIELAWYALATRVPVSRVIAAESTIDWYGLQPGGQILVLGLCMALAATLAWAQQRRRLQETAAFHIALYLAGGLMASATAFAFGLDADSDAPAWIAPAIWGALLAMLGLARWQLPTERRGLLDILVAGCLGYLLVSLGVDSHPAMLAASAALILSALAMSVRFWPVSRASALLLLPTTLWIGYATAIMP
jgi:sulfoxide reductase heme-binding subunit YedZ